MIKPPKSNWPKPSGCLKIAITKVYDSYDPSDIITTDHAFVIINVIGKLIEVGEDNGLYSAIAASWHVSPDKRTYRLKLSDQAKFSNGTSITVEDVMMSIKRHLLLSGTHIDLKDKVLGGQNFKNIDDNIPGLRVISKSEIEIEINNSDERFLYWVAFPEMAILPKEEAIKPKGALSFNVTSGPYYLKKSLGYLHLEKNPYFYFKHGDAADCIQLHGYEVPENVANDLFSKQLDVIDYGAALAPIFSKFINNEDFSLVMAESRSSIYFAFNTRTKVGSQISNRRWIKSNIRPAELIPYGNNHVFAVANQFLIDTHQGFLAQSEVLEANNHILIKRPNISTLKLLYPAVFGKSYQDLLKQKLSEQLRVSIEIVTYEEGHVLDALTKDNWDLFFYLVGMGEKATNILFGYHFRGVNPLYTWKDDLVDKAMETMNTTNNEAERVEQYKIVSKQLLKQAYIVPVASFKWPIMMRSDLYFNKTNKFQWGNPIWSLSWKK